MAEITWELLEKQVEACALCGLCEGITHKVVGQGDRQSPLMLIGEGPGAEEDRTGLPFVGRAGQLLTKMLAAIELPRERVYICNTVKCRPPENRIPKPAERAACLMHLRMQCALLRPKVILILGASAAKTVLGEDTSITRTRGQWRQRGDTWILATYHPSALLRDPSKKPDAWHDLQLLRDKLIDLGCYSDIYGA